MPNLMLHMVDAKAQSGFLHEDVYGHRVTLYDSGQNETGDWGGIPLRSKFVENVEPFKDYYGKIISLRYWGGPSFIPANNSPDYTIVAKYIDDADENGTQLHRDGTVVSTYLKGNASIIISTYDGNSDGIGGRIILFGSHPEDLTWKYGTGYVKEGYEEGIFPAYIYVNKTTGKPMKPYEDHRDLIRKAAIWAVTPLIQNHPPNAPDKPNPSNGATGISIDVTLSWHCSDPDQGDVLTYDIYFGTSSNPPLVASGITSTSYTPGTLSYSTTYYWRVVAKDEHGATTSSETWHFTTEAAPAPPPSPKPLPPGDVIMA